MRIMTSTASPNSKHDDPRPRFRGSRALVLAVLMPALVTGGCGWGGGSQKVAQESPPPAPQAAQPAQPAPEQAAPPAEAPADEVYERPEVVEQAARAPEAADPEARRHEVRPPSPAATAKVESLAERERRLREREAEVAAREAAVTARETGVAEEEAPAETEETAAAPAASDQVAEATVSEAPEEAPPPPPPPKVDVHLAAGTALDLEFVRTVSSATARVGDTFRTRVNGDVYDDRGNLAIPAGSEVVGQVTEAVPLPKVGGRARLGLRFTDVVLPGGETAKVSASLVEQGKNETGRDAATIGGATAGGAILGRILDRGKKKRGTVLGAIIGAAAGAAIASKSEGEEVEIPAGSVIAVKLDHDLEMRVPQRR